MIANIARRGLAAFAIAAVAACSNTPLPVAITITPTSATVTSGGTAQFMATVLDATNTAVAWTVAEGASGGTVDATGLYTAPTVSSATVFHVVATAAADATKSATAAVTVNPQGSGIDSVVVTPGAVSLRTSATAQFSATVSGTAADTVTWTVAAGGAGGAVDQTGLYTAPATAGHDVVIATSTVDPTKTGTAAVTVTLEAPPAISYSPSAVVCVINTACSLPALFNAGGPYLGLAINPALPAGMTFDSSSGAISGTPTVVSAAANYFVTAVNSGGASTTQVSIQVKDIPPSIAYQPPALVCGLGSACSLGAPVSSGGTVISYSISPALPAGLSIDVSSGAISGTPTVISSTSAYTVTATNSGGSATTSISVSVTDVAPAQLVYNPSSLVCTVNAACSLAAPTHTGGGVTGYAINGNLPNGLTFDPGTGAIAGTPTALFPSTVYVVTASNSGGGAIADVSVTVVDVPPTNVAYSHGLTCNRGSPCSDGPPLVTGGGPVTGFSITPPLPIGLAIDPATGIISGTPTVAIPSTSFTVSAFNSGGAATTQVAVLVKDFPPTSLVYNPNALTCVQAQVCTLGPPTNAGGAITGYTISPALPQGLSIGAASGIISGVPIPVSPLATYTVTGTNSSGVNATTTITVEVQLGPPGNLRYNPDSLTCSVGVPCQLAAPTHTGGAVDTYGVVGETPLPDGLSVDPATGAISGTPDEEVETETIAIGAMNDAGATSTTISVTVNGPPPSGLAYDPPTLTCVVGEECESSAPTANGGAIDGFAIAPALPDGLSIDPSSGVISGTPSLSATDQSYTVTATNSSGQATAPFDVIIYGPPASVTYTPGAVTCTIGQPCVVGAPAVTGQPADIFFVGGCGERIAGRMMVSCAQGLPQGLEVNSQTGAITGTPTALLDSTDFTVYGGNDYGSTGGVINLTVINAEPGALTYSPAELDCHVGQFCSSGSPSSAGGVPSGYTISPALPDGLSLDSSGNISGTPTAAQAVASYTVTGSNDLGSGTGTISIAISAGQAWTQLGPAGGLAYQMVANPTAPDNLYVWMRGDTFFSSSDDGATWQSNESGAERANPTSLAFAPDGALFGCTNGGVYMSLDGATWTLRGLANIPCYSIAVDGADDGTLYALETYNQQSPVRSTDSGETWTQLDAGVGLYGGYVSSPPTGSHVVYFNTAQHIYKSTDSGDTFAESDTGILTEGTLGLTQLAIDPANANNLYISASQQGVVYHSINGGQSWAGSSEGLGDATDLTQVVLSGADSAVVYVGSDSGAFVSTDSGQTWNPYSTANGDAPIFSDSHGHVFASDYSGIYENGGDLEGTLPRITGLDAMILYGMSIDSAGNLYVTGESGSFVYNQAQQQWSELDSRQGWQISVNPANASNIAVRLADGEIMTSLDSGSDWTVNEGAPSLNNIGRLADGRLWGAGNGFFLSTDDGQSWTESDQGMSDPNAGPEAPPAQSTWAASLASSPGTILVATQGALYLSTDSGSSWNPAGAQDSYVSVASDPSAPMRFYALSSNGSLYRSDDGGQNFTDVFNTPVNGGVLVAVDTDGTVYVTGYQGYLYMSTDAGVDFTTEASGIIGEEVTGFASYQGTQYICTVGGSVMSSTSRGL